MKLGILAHTYGRLPVAELARKVAAEGFASVQLALLKAIADIDCSPGKLSPGLANHIAETFDREGVRIAVLGCYIDPVHPDRDARRAEIDRFKEHLRLARDFGCGLVGTETGSLTTFRDSHPLDYREQGWSVLRETMSELAEEAEKWGASLAIEPVAGHTLDSLDDFRRLLDEVPSTTVRLLFDACNLMNAQRLPAQDDLMRGAFETLAERMVLIHAKDLVFEEAGEGSEQPARRADRPVGDGLLHTDVLCALLKRHKPHIDISIEGVTAETARRSADRLREIYANA
ncbi:sugar phosphate isomerase/epimerase [Saccharibacillus sp. CPCC 101409]|uniref:sugar phosphate isomerase/epimerase family protein n=1 Tax=Saccharibacillus sp. CPCC 101409 TaxID=3058041 RepID=UPI0026710BFB|nr:sugar phosphate isomerase/epimerase [Saccharibacillus sp. CPCC 101409]MDO3412765.1 sugar phosphate isomerase/epimerase [Saccharibacillus sp. CPCC 101409]